MWIRTNLTTAEEILWEKLSDRRLFKVNFRRQHPIDIFIVDFYCHKYKLAIEVDGDIHLDEDVLSHDKGREFEIEKLGIKILQFTNREVMVEIIEVTNKILH